MQGDFDESNTTLFVGGLAPAVAEADLSNIFHTFGVLSYVRVPPGRGCGFVQFLSRAQAERALQGAQGHMLHGAPLRLSWGRNAAKHARPHAAGASVAAGYFEPPMATGTSHVQHHAPAAASSPAMPQVQQYRRSETAWQSNAAGAYFPGAHAEPMDLWHGMYGEAAATSGEGVGHGGYTGHPDANKTASRFGFEDPTTCDFAAANRRFASVAPPLLAPIAMAPARRVLHAGVMSYKAAV